MFSWFCSYIVTRRVKRGAKLLSIYSPGWEKKIDLHILKMESYRYCILGQLYGNYYKGIKDLNLTSKAACKNGFSTTYFGEGFTLFQYGIIFSFMTEQVHLNRAWRLEVMYRIAAGRQVPKKEKEDL